MPDNNKNISPYSPNVIISDAASAGLAPMTNEELDSVVRFGNSTLDDIISNKSKMVVTNPGNNPEFKDDNLIMEAYNRSYQEFVDNRRKQQQIQNKTTINNNTTNIVNNQPVSTTNNSFPINSQTLIDEDNSVNTVDSSRTESSTNSITNSAQQLSGSVSQVNNLSETTGSQTTNQNQSFTSQEVINESTDENSYVKIVKNYDESGKVVSTQIISSTSLPELTQPEATPAPEEPYVSSVNEQITETISPKPVDVTQTPTSSVEFDFFDFGTAMKAKSEASLKEEIETQKNPTGNTVNNQLTKNVQGSRVDNSQMISKSQYNQIVKPENPVVKKVDEMNQDVTRGLVNVSETVKTSVNSIQTNSPSTTNSSSTQYDQSTNINQMGGDPIKVQDTEKKDQSEGQMQGEGLNEFYLSSIYDILASGIKVKITQ